MSHRLWIAFSVAAGSINPVYAAPISLAGAWECIGDCHPAPGTRMIEQDAKGNVTFLNPANPAGTATTKITAKGKRFFIKQWNTYVHITNPTRLTFDDGPTWEKR